MDSSYVTDIKRETFATQSQRQGDALLVTLCGNADMDVHDELRAFLDDLHEGAKANGVKELVFDLKELYFMNSSCLSTFLRLINRMVASRASHAYGLRFRTNQNLGWQRRNLQAIRAYAEELVSVE
jgi:anti-anti-sigma factor